jgi:hypothetical protein
MVISSRDVVFEKEPSADRSLSTAKVQYNHNNRKYNTNTDVVNAIEETTDLQPPTQEQQQANEIEEPNHEEIEEPNHEQEAREEYPGWAWEQDPRYNHSAAPSPTLEEALEPQL